MPSVNAARQGGRFSAMGKLSNLGRCPGGERHPQVSTDDVDDGLAMFLVVLGQAFQRVQAAQPDRRLLAAELLDCLGIQLGDAPLGRVMIGLVAGDFLVYWRRKARMSPTAAPAPAPAASPVRTASSRALA